MGIWRRHKHFDRPSGHALAILEEVERKLEALDPRPVVMSVRVGAGLRDHFDFEVEVELARGATLAVRYQSVDEEGRDPDNLENEGGAVAWQVVNEVGDMHSLGVDRLADAMHDLRVVTRRTLAKWSASGTHVTLIDIRFVRTEFWAPHEKLMVEARVRSLDDRLQPTTWALQADSPDELEAELAAWGPRITERYATQAALANAGAEGWVDRLVLNATPRHWNVADMLRGTMAGRLYERSGELSLFMYGGHLRCHGSSIADGLSWNRDTLTLHDREFPDALCRALLRQPVTELIAHPVATDDMIITRVSSLKDSWSPRRVEIECEQPRLVFCGCSGRVWTPDAETAAGWRDPGPLYPGC